MKQKQTMATKKQSNNQVNTTLSKPPSNRTVVSPRPRGKRVPAKMPDAIKQKDKDYEEGVKDDKETKDEFDKESIPLTEKEAHIDKHDIFRTDSTLSSGDVDVLSIPNVVQNETTDGENQTNKDVGISAKFETGGNTMDGNQKEKTETDGGISNEDVDKAKVLETDSSVTGIKTVVDDRGDDEKKNGVSLKGSTMSMYSKESNSDKIKTSSISINSKGTNNDAGKGSTISLNSKEEKRDAKSVGTSSKEGKTISSKGISVSLNSKAITTESRPTSNKTLSSKSEIVNKDVILNENKKDIKSNGLYKEKGNKDNEAWKNKAKSLQETKVTVTDLSCNGVTHTLTDENTQNNIVTADKISLTVPGQVVDKPDSPKKNSDSRKGSNASDTARRESTKFSIGSRKSVDLPVQYTTVQMPTTEDKTKPSVYATEDSWIRIAIPYLPVSLAVFCLFLNVVIPGFGTIISGFSIFCCGKSRVPPKYDQDLLVLLCVNIWVGVAQLFTVSFMLVGWFWSLAWGVKMVILALERRQELKDQRAKELQTLALKAFGSSIPAAHLTPMT